MLKSIFLILASLSFTRADVCDACDSHQCITDCIERTQPVVITLNGTFTLTNEILINSTQTVTIIGNDNTIDANETSRHFEVKSGGNLTLTNLTLTNGDVSFSSGGSISNNGTLTLDHCTFSGNKAFWVVPFPIMKVVISDP